MRKRILNQVQKVCRRIYINSYGADDGEPIQDS